MVVSKKKTNNYSYAERVLRSFSLIQREHKKHAIHLASLKAQIQKTAASRKDKLGRNWKSWVLKAVHRLEGDGILAPAEPAGSYVLTANGKKIISTARHLLQLPNNDSLTPDQEDLLWKQVTHPTSVQATKRVRRPNESDDEDPDDDEQTEYVLPSPRKRPRPSAPNKTKAQLVEEIAILERALEADRLRAESPLTVLDDDESEELMRLKEIVRHKDDEIRDLQRQLADQTFDHDDPLDTTTVSLPVHISVMRTQSGSFIDQLSKQPTPAPTELDPNEYDDRDMFDLPDPIPVRHSFDNTIVTPDATPAKNQRMNDTESSHGRALATELRILENKLAQVTVELSHKNTRIDTLQTDLNASEARVRETAGALASQASEISAFESAKAALEASITEKVAQCETLVRERDDAATRASAESAKLREAEARGEALEARLADATVQLGAAQEASSRAAAEALKQIAALDAALSERISEHRKVQEQLTGTQAELETVQLNAGILEVSLRNVRGELEAQKLERVSLQERVKRSEKALCDQEQQLTETRSSEEALKKQLQVAQGTSASLLDQLAASEAAKATLIADLDATSAHAADMTTKFVDAEVAGEELKNEMASKEERIEELRVQLAESVARLEDLKQTLVISGSKHASAMAEKETLLASVQSDNERLTQELLAVRKEQEQVRERLEGDVRTMTHALDAEKQRNSKLETECAEAIARAQEVEEEILELQVLKETDAATIEGLKDVLSQLRAVQVQSLAKLDNKLESAHSSPVPKRRTSRIATRTAS